jgi:hypothetical protein
MGLHNTANYLKTKGRGRDTELVHMSPREIKGLQALALAHGGSLTVNPETGLVEAGFLERILPMVAGAALTFTGVGAPLAALMVGGGYGLATGSVEKGLMAGLGAYGGAGLAGSLSAMGGQAAAQAGQQAAVKGFETTAQEAVAQGSQEVAKEAAKTAALEGTTLPANYADLYAKTGGAQEFTKQAAQGFLENPNNFPGLTSQTLQGYQSALNAPGAVPTDVIGAAGSAQGAAGATTAGNVARGVKEVSTSLPAAGDFIGSNIGTIGSAAIPLLAADQQGAPTGYTEDEYDRYLKGYQLGPNYQAYEAPRPNPYYRPQYAAQGGIMKLQGGGGPVERMSMMNTAMNPQGGMYPQGMIDKTQYATPTQRPVSAELMMDAPAYERSSPMLMAEGGIARYRNKGQVNVLQDYIDRQGQQQMSPLPRTSGMPGGGIYRDTDVDTAKKDALTATMIRLGKIGKGAGIKASALPKTSIKGLGDIRGATPEVEQAAAGGTMRYNLGGYSDGGRMLKGPGDGMSDSIPATIAGKQPARLADGEFVVPADVVSHLGNGSTDAGAKKLYGMMAKIRKARTGKKKQAPAVKANKYMPA